MKDKLSDLELSVVDWAFQPFHLGHCALAARAQCRAARAVAGWVCGRSAARQKLVQCRRAHPAIAGPRRTSSRPWSSFATVRGLYDEARWAGAVRRPSHARVQGNRLGRLSQGRLELPTSTRLRSGKLALPRQAPITAASCGDCTSATGRRSPRAGRGRAPPSRIFWGSFETAATSSDCVKNITRWRARARSTAAVPFVTVDAVVTENDRILLVQRGRAPGKDLWALPGGSLDGSERLASAALRELREETRLPCRTPSSARRCAAWPCSIIHNAASADAPSPMPTILLCRLTADTPPRVSGADDAQAARSVPVSQIPSMTEDLFEDHYQIIDHFPKVSADRGSENSQRSHGVRAQSLRASAQHADGRVSGASADRRCSALMKPG